MKRKESALIAAASDRSAAGLTATAAAVLLAWSAPGQAQIVADPAAPAGRRPTVLSAPNGVPLVNIQAPSAGGVSRNTYRRFDVPQAGTILNNSGANVQTQLGGWIQGNPALVGGSARVILNEVNSSSASVLRGFLEVAGQRADVVVANPAGITVDGAGFINASRATLTTGTPVIGQGGALDGFQVRDGVVTVHGAGLDARGTDYTAILARAVALNAGVWANQLRVVTGSVSTSADGVLATPLAPATPAPAFAIDTAQLGGMYAGHIFLVSTEAGVGVRNAGTWGASGNLVLSADGLLTNAGAISAGDVLQSGSRGVGNSGTVFGKAGLAIESEGQVANTSVIASGADLSIRGGSIVSGAGSTLAAGVRDDGSVGSSGSLFLSSSGQVAARGRNLAGADLSVSGDSIDMAASQSSARNIGYQTVEQATAIIDMVKNLPETLDTLQAIVTDPEFRAKVGEQLADQYKARVEMQTRAYQDGTWDWAAAGSVDTGLSFLSLLELYRADVAERRVTPSRVVEALDVVKHV